MLLNDFILNGVFYIENETKKVSEYDQDNDYYS